MTLVEIRGVSYSYPGVQPVQALRDVSFTVQENEFVYVYFGHLNGALAPDPTEIADVALLCPDDIAARIKREPATFTFWLKHYFHTHGADIARLAAQVTA